MKRTLILVTCLAFLLVGFAAMGLFAGDAPETVTLEAKNGTVTFPHKKHVEEIKVECTKCHHTQKEGEAVQKCTDCHGKDENAPKVMNAFHGLCKDCHKAKNEEGKAAPTECKGCHVKA
ncbi:MAG TPA: cytochrome c3 family protein [Thermoanaerobaculia bacterium]|nr:cytochrome c3 family protein [Thermoanaerobaculia bacterium]HUM30448.1 cytochrome c3 family protein [Thermoanaerobaculia bacterium]HXK68685.1 cytochrome c3 family protein [Thermoanaerobaculia bacterium]